MELTRLSAGLQVPCKIIQLVNNASVNMKSQARYMYVF